MSYPPTTTELAAELAEAAQAESYDNGNRAGYDDGYAGETVPPRMYRRADADWKDGYDVGHEQGAADREAAEEAAR